MQIAPSSPKSLILFGIWMAVLAVIVVWCAFLVRDVLLLIYVSGLLAIGFSPIVRLIERQKLMPIGTRRFPRWLAILILYVFIIGTLTGIGFLVVPPLVHQAQQLWTALPSMFDRAQEFLIAKGILKEHLTLREAVERAPGTNTEAVGTVLGAVIGVVGGLFGLLTILILTFYMLVEADSLRDSMLRLFPGRDRDRVAGASRDIMVKVSAWLGGQLLLGGIIGATSAIGLWLLGIPFFYVLALISAIGEMIPVVGPILAAIPAIAVAASVSLNKVVLVIVFFIVQQQFENHVLVPKVMERQVGVSAVTVIMALLIGGKLLGIVGAILAVPSAAIILVVFSELSSRRDQLRSSASGLQLSAFSECRVRDPGSASKCASTGVGIRIDGCLREEAVPYGKPAGDCRMCGSRMVKLGRPGVTRRNMFGDLALLIFLVAQASDGVLTYIGVRTYGLTIEGNPLIGWLMAAMGQGAGLATAKVAAGGFGIALHLSSVHKAVALLGFFYMAVAVLPWVAILFYLS